VFLKKIFFLLFMLSTTLLNAQYIFKGRIVDAANKQPLESAFVQIENEKISALTDKNGNFSFAAQTNTATIVISYIGFQTKRVSAISSSVLNIELEAGTVELKDLLIMQSGGFKNSSISKVDLNLKPVNNSQEVLRTVPGLFIAQHAGGGKAEQIFLRGFDCDHGTDILVSVDDMPVNMVSHAHGQGYADAHFIIPETINNINYGTGPYNTQKGNLSTAGFVNFSTYKTIDKNIFQVEAGRFDTYRVLTMIDLLKKNKTKQSAYIAAEANFTNGPTENKQHFNRFNLFGKYNYQLSEATQFTTSVSAFKSEWDASGQMPARAVESGMIGRFGSIDPTEGGKTERYNLNINVDHQFRNGATFQNQLYLSRYAFDLFSNFSFFLKDSINGDQVEQKEKRTLTGFNSQFNKKYFIKNWSLNSIVGTGFRYDATKNSGLAHTIERRFINSVKLGDIKELNAFAFIQQQMHIGGFYIDAGVRLDEFHFSYNDKLNATQLPAQSVAIISPKLNIQYNASKNIQLYAKAGKGFHSNDARVVVENNGTAILPAAYGTDLGITLKPAKNLYLDIAAWYLFLQQEFVYVGDDGIVEPSGKTVRKGIDVIARYQFNKHLFANANVNFTKPRSADEPKGENYIPLAPIATSTGGITYKTKTGLNAGISYRYIKDRPAAEDNSIIAKGYFITDISLAYTHKKYELGLSAQNLFNIKWNEAQFATESKLRFENSSTTELNFTPGNPLFIKARLAIFF
jgi:outer membrane cobalamin receptor